ncbi:MAG: hypothetical protein MUC88_16095 [Planctomycetes bacterium]|jgi:hypothetical protein|nr:hypothetical protein [Planctomycetota bacterium]
MAILRRALRATGLAGVAFFGLLAVTVILTFPHEVSRNNTLIESFSSAASWIDAFEEANGRLPSPDEYFSWTASQPQAVYGIRSVQLLAPSSAEFYREAVAAFGEPNAVNSYALAIWTGDENEYYASWANTSTVNSSLRYYGSVLLLDAFFVAAASACWYVAHRCRSTTRISRDGAAQSSD